MRNKIRFVPEDYESNEVTTRLEFETDDEGGMYASIYIDHICVAYFSTVDGALTLLPIEVGSRFNSNEEALKDIKYLEDKGFKLDKVPHRWDGPDYWEYYFRAERG